eukprot:CAMPEP_0168220488 /NCGR_PEP_ID=MMETSP0140_2-20121125/9286_1 /TAXON_ID=44445 /ORGANISM="Pseudo-nitzschia australis, Strain 10249 10 AB" /LENGTH=62 /DNA_ID=CAMNT_0008149271 /DNA_START=759 /DNA_END=947 /DNA_ORIENTATION=-
MISNHPISKENASEEVKVRMRRCAFSSVYTFTGVAAMVDDNDVVMQTNERECVVAMQLRNEK